MIHMMVGIVGFIGSGKGTVGDILHRDHNFEVESFAKPLKDAASCIFGWNRELLEGATSESRSWREQPDKFWSEAFGKSFTPREALQLLGTESCRDIFHQDIWVSSLINRCKQRNVVITDVRFKNEVNGLRKHNAILIRVKRGDDPQWYETAYLANQGHVPSQQEMKQLGIHISEWDWVGSTFDYTIKNDGTIEDLRSAVKQILELEHLDRS